MTTPITIYDTAGVERLRGSSSGGGGSQPFKVVRRVLAFDTANLESVALPITAVDQGADTFTVAGDYTAYFDRLLGNPGSFSVSGSTGNDGFYQPTGPSTFAAGHTTVPVAAVPDATADGDINALVGGITVHTPSDGDLLLASFVSVPTAFNGSTSTIRLFQAATDPSNDDLAFDVTAADSPYNSSVSPNVWTTLQSANAQAWADGAALTMLAAGGDLTAILCDTATLGPDGSTAGECVLHLLILTAP